MRKLFSAIMILCLLFALTACGGEVPEPDPSGTGNGEQKGLTAYELWEQLKGVWLNEGADMYDFAFFSTEGPDLCFTYGIFFSEFMEGGVISDYAFDGTAYSFTVNCAEIAGNEEFEGRPAYSFRVELIPGEKLQMTDAVKNDGQMYPFRRIADDFATVDFDELMFGPKVDPALIWERMAGVWCCADGDTYYFMQFAYDEQDGAPFLFTGIPFSGYGMANTPSRAYGNGGDQWVVVIEFNGYENYITISVTGSGDGTVSMTNVAGSGNVMDFTYMCEKLEDLDIDALFSL